MMDRFRYDKVQLEKYFDRIALPSLSRIYDVTNLSSTAQLQFLSQLQKQQLINVPFENLTLHYSWHRVVDVNADHLYDKIVGEKRGGYCMENNTFFHTVLLSLGYDVYITGARVYNPSYSRYGGFSHCLNIVTIDGVRYAVDVGFGSRCPVRPLRLYHGEINHQKHIGQMRLVYDHIPQALCQNQRVWIYEYRASDDGEWVPQYCFTESEFLPEDIRVMNLSPSRSPSSFFTFKVVCVMFTTNKSSLSAESMDNTLADQTSQEGDTAIEGILIIDGNTFKWRNKGEIKWEKTFHSEADRLKALREYFGITFTKENERAIQGTAGTI